MSEANKLSTLRHFGDYVLFGEIGEGGMGVIWHALQVSLNRAVALKMILAGRLATPDQIHRFHTEAEAAATLDHPNIVPVYETGQEDGQHFISMKLIDGESLAQQIREGTWRIHSGNKKARQSSIARLMMKSAQAVHHAHQRGVLHRDLKPGNILIDERGEPQITDFGLAKLIEHDDGPTQTGAIMGSIPYMPPEQAEGKFKEVTVAADVYSLGAVLFELLTGEAPFTGENPIQTLQRVVEDEPPRPTALNPNIDHDLETICLKCLEKKPARRYSSAEALAADLGRWLNGEPILARPVKQWERGWKWIRRHPVATGLIGTMALSLLLASGLGLLWQHSKAATTLARLKAAEGAFEGGDAHLGFATLARRLRDQPNDRLAAERLVNALPH